MKVNWARDAFSETNAAIALLGAVLTVAAVVSAAFGHELTAAWLVAAALACLAGVLWLMYVKAATERDAAAPETAVAPVAEVTSQVAPIGSTLELVAQSS